MRIIKEKKIVDETINIDLFSILFASCLFVGYIPKASGTFGSLFALLFFLLKGFEKIIILLPLTIIFFIVGTHTSKILMKRYGADSSVIVVDEVVGMWITILVFQLLSPLNLSFFYIIVSFIAFRIFDIVKVPPAKYFDETHTGIGVMMDDVIAGIYAGIVVYLISLTNFNPAII